MTGIVHFRFRKSDVVKSIEIGLVHIVLVSQVRINGTAAVTQTESKCISCLYIIKIGSGTIGSQSCISIVVEDGRVVRRKVCVQCIRSGKVQKP